MVERGRFLMVTGDFGGNVQPMLGMGRMLRARGHEVRVLGPRTVQRRVVAARCAFLPYPVEVELDPAKGRAWEDQGEFWVEMATSRSIPDAVRAAIEDEPADALVVDCMLDNAQWAAERSGLPSAVLVHSQIGIWSDLSWWEGWAKWLPRANATRSELGLAALPDDASLVPLWERLGAVLVSMPRELDLPSRTPHNVRYVGPVFEEEPRAGSWRPPWPADDHRPLVVVSLGSTYMHHEVAVERVLQAVSSIDARVLYTSGFGLDPDEVDIPANVVVERYVPHVEVLPHADLVVTHAGMGTVLAACTYGVPMMCVPLGRDQPEIAERVEALGCSRTVDRDADPDTVRATIADALGSPDLHEGARRMSEIVAGYGAGAMAADALEGLLEPPSASERGGGGCDEHQAGCS